MIPSESKIKKRIVVEAHMTPYLIQLSSAKTYQDLRISFWLEGMNRDIVSFVEQCSGKLK